MAAVTQRTKRTVNACSCGWQSAERSATPSGSDPSRHRVLALRDSGLASSLGVLIRKTGSYPHLTGLSQDPEGCATGSGPGQRCALCPAGGAAAPPPGRGSARLDSALFGSDPLFQTRLCSAAPAKARPDSALARLSSAAVGKSRLCPAWLAPARRRALDCQVPSLAPRCLLPAAWGWASGVEAPRPLQSGPEAPQPVRGGAVGPGLAEPWAVPRVPQACPRPVAGFSPVLEAEAGGPGSGSRPHPHFYPEEAKVGCWIPSHAPWRAPHPRSAASRPVGREPLLHLFPLASVSPSNT